MQVQRILWASPPPTRSCRRSMWTLRKFFATAAARQGGRGQTTRRRRRRARGKHASTQRDGGPDHKESCRIASAGGGSFGGLGLPGAPEGCAKRLDDPMRQWKISESDYSARKLWPDYVEAYEELRTLLIREIRIGRECSSKEFF